MSLSHIVEVVVLAICCEYSLYYYWTLIVHIHESDRTVRCNLVFSDSESQLHGHFHFRLLHLHIKE